MKHTRRRMNWAVAIALALSPIGVPAAEKDKDKKDKPDFPDFKEVTKDMEVKEGFLTLYHHVKQDRLLAGVPKALLGKRFFLASTIAGGPDFTGFQWSDGVVYWERRDKKLVLMEAEPRYEKGKDAEVGDVIGRTYPDAIVRAVDIVTENPSGDPVIDLADLFKTDFLGLGEIYSRHVDRGLSRWAQIKAFPNNVELCVDAALMAKDGGGPTLPLHYSLSRLPEKSDYEPRVADDRVGYFLTVVKDWTVDRTEKTVFRRHIHRWRLRRNDPKAEVSDVTPETQIVFYLEKTIPKQYRRYVRDGILEWNKAFEKAGFRNALAVFQQTDSVHAEKDPEDVRYNFIRWIVTGEPFAMGPSRVDPFTGQILDADIVIDDSMIRYMIHHDFEVLGPKAISPFHDPQLESLLASDPNLHFAAALDDLLPARTAASDAAGARQVIRERIRPCCEQGKAAVLNLSLASALFAQATGQRTLPEEFIGQALKETVMHEVGHTLGLRHNFKASSWKTLEQIAALASLDEPITGSVMDYNPYNFAAVADKQGIFATPTLGPYDDWAIEYGYKELGEPHKKEGEMLQAIASRAAQTGLAYGTDEDAYGFAPDPLTFPFDNGSDPVAFGRQAVERFARLTMDAPDWAVKDGESYAALRRAVNVLFGHCEYAVLIAARQVGGQYVHRDHKGDPDARAPFVPVPAERQRETLKFLGESVFSATAFQLPPDLLNHLGPARWAHWDSDQYDRVPEFRIHDRVRALQSRVLFMLLNPLTLARVYEAPSRVPDGTDVLALTELFAKLSDRIWAELDELSASRTWSNRQPRVPSFRRNLQREHLRYLLDIVLAPAPWAGSRAEVVAVARASLEDLLGRIHKTLALSRTQLDDYTRAHLDECKVKITKALEAEFVAR